MVAAVFETFPVVLLALVVPLFVVDVVEGLEPVTTVTPLLPVVPLEMEFVTPVASELFEPVVVTIAGVGVLAT